MNLSLLATKVFAQDMTEPINTGAIEITSIGQFATLITNIIIIVGVAVVVVMLAVGFVRYVTSQGDKNAVDAAQKTLTYAVIGGVGLVLVYAIRTIIFNFLGVDVETITSQEGGN